MREGILLAPERMFSNSNRDEHFVHLNCGWPRTAEIDAAIKRLGELCGQLARK